MPKLRHLAQLVCGPLLLGLAAVLASWWVLLVVQADGPGWFPQRLPPLWANLEVIVVLGMLGALLGGAVGMVLSARPHRLLATTFLAALFLGLLRLAITSLQWAQFWHAVDWIPTIGFLCTGAAIGFGWGWAARNTAISAWPLLATILLAAAAASVAVGAPGAWLGVFALLLLGDALGRRLGCLLDPEPDAPPAPFYIRTALGLAVMISGFRLIGLLGGAGRPTTGIILVLLAVSLWRELGTDLHAAYSFSRTPRRAGCVAWTLAGALMALVFIFWLSTLAPETGPDAIGGRSSLPHLWARTGSIHAVPEIALSYMGIGGEVLNLIALPICGENVAKVTTVVAAILLAQACGTMARGRLGWCWLILLLLFGSTAVWWHFFAGFVDLSTAVLVVAALGAFGVADRGAKERWLLAAGFLGGTAAAVKLHGGAVLVVLGSATLLNAWRRERSFSGIVRPVCFLAAGAALALVPSAVRSLLLTGNPVFPFANGVFASPLAEAKLTARLYGAGLDRNTVFLPLRTVLMPHRFHEIGTYHPFFWVLTLGAIVSWPFTDRTARFLQLSAGFLWLVWVLTEQNIRYSLPALACTAFAVAATFGALRVPSPLRHWPGLGLTLMAGRWLTLFAAAVGIAVNLIRPTVFSWQSIAGPALPRDFVTGAQTASDFRSAYLRTGPLGDYMNAHYGANATVWQVPWVRDHLSFDCRTIALPHGDLRLMNSLRDILPDRPAGLDHAQILTRLQELGITHLICDDGCPWVNGLGESVWNGLFAPAFAEAHLRLEYAHRGLRLYRIGSALKPQLEAGGPEAESAGIPVRPGGLYAVRIAWEATPERSTNIALIWTDESGGLLLYDLLAVPTKTPQSWIARWQSAPAGATRLRINRHDTPASISIDFLEYPTDQP